MLFGWHKDVYEIWARDLREYKPLFYTGDETPQLKEHNKQKFMAGESNLLICSLKSGVGLDGIQDRCNVGVIGELDWSPAIITQCVGRYHRDGQANPCLTYMMISEAGLDPYMIQTLGIKRLRVDGIVLDEDGGSVMDSINAATHLRELAKSYLKFVTASP